MYLSGAYLVNPCVQIHRGSSHGDHGRGDPRKIFFTKFRSNKAAVDLIRKRINPYPLPVWEILLQRFTTLLKRE